MNDRQRFIATMHYQPRDRCPLYDFNFWDETLPLWYEQGLPRRFTRRNVREYFGLDSSLGGGEPADWGTGVDNGLRPEFEHRIVEDFGDEFIEMQGDGVLVKRQRSSRSIPMHMGHTLVDRDSWRQHYLPRLDPADPDRYPRDWDRRVKLWRDPNRDHPIMLPGGSLFGKLRDWMGMENIAMVVYDDPAWFEEMVETMCVMVEVTLGRILATGGRFEACSMWEDMCYNAGPLLAPEHFRKYLVPRYRRITDLCRKHGVDVIYLDCDGLIEHLMPLWLEAGVNCMFPIEIGTWGADPIKYRKQYGKGLLMMGGVDKHILARSKRDIEAEVKRLAPLVEQGGYIPLPDHRVPPDVPLENYVHYCREIRKVWGRNIDLKPMLADAAA